MSSKTGVRLRVVDSDAAPRPRDFRSVRSMTTTLCEPLELEDYGPQSMPDASPAKWHLAHTTWFFERFVLQRERDYRPFHPDYERLFNSYYDAVGPQYARAARGLLSRPTVLEVYRYRQYVDEHMLRMLEGSVEPALAAVLWLGLHHEQQHQELLLTDIKHLLAANPLRPAYRESLARPIAPAEGPLRWSQLEGGAQEIGAEPSAGFCFDNECPRHRVHLAPFALAERLVSNAEYREFVLDGGYRDSRLWLSDGWQQVQAGQWQAPLYWGDSLQSEFTLGGDWTLDPARPACHLSYYEADAFARWAGVRLPTEAEWEYATAHEPAVGTFLESGALHPQPPLPGQGMQQLFGDTWEWTASAYLPYPGFRPWAGALGEYNGKFMVNQFVLRGGSCATPITHIRASYRNFFHPHSRWQFTGIRLAKDL
jgi:ergothioneine biosynthesis protein EgtB